LPGRHLPYRRFGGREFAFLGCAACGKPAAPRADDEADRGLVARLP